MQNSNLRKKNCSDNDRGNFSPSSGTVWWSPWQDQLLRQTWSGHLPKHWLIGLLINSVRSVFSTGAAKLFYNWTDSNCLNDKKCILLFMPSAVCLLSQCKSIFNIHSFYEQVATYKKYSVISQYCCWNALKWFMILLQTCSRISEKCNK